MSEFDDQHQDHHHHHHEHHDEGEQHNQHHQISDQHSNSGDSTTSSTQNDNGYVFVPPTKEPSGEHVSSSSSSNQVENVLDLLTNATPEQEQRLGGEIERMLADIGSRADAKLDSKLASLGETIRAEADSSSSLLQEQAKPKPAPAAAKKDSAATCSPNANFLCPYYVMAMDRLSKVEIPPKVKDVLLWRNPKLTGAIFGSSFVLLVSIACFSLLTVVSALFLTALTLIGSYRFYLALIFRIKGTYDDTFDKLSAQDVSLPKDKVQNLARLLETDFNRTLNKLKSILLWDNITTSAIAFFGFYVVYCIGCMFNTITLMLLTLVSLFTLPKIYEVYKQPIDQAIEKVTTMAHQTVKQIMTKLPMLNKKKTQ